MQACGAASSPPARPLLLVGKWMFRGSMVRYTGAYVSDLPWARLKRALRLSFLTPSLVPSPNSPPKVRGPRALCVASLRRGGRILLLGHSRLRLWVVWDSGMSVPGPRARSKRALRLSFLGTKRRGGRTIWDTRGARRAARGILWLVLVGRQPMESSPWKAAGAHGGLSRATGSASRRPRIPAWVPATMQPGESTVCPQL